VTGDIRGEGVEIHEAEAADWPPIWDIFRVVVGAGETGGSLTARCAAVV
jgi:hypothetical protein